MSSDTISGVDNGPGISDGPGISNYDPKNKQKPKDVSIEKDRIIKKEEDTIEPVEEPSFLTNYNKEIIPYSTYDIETKNNNSPALLRLIVMVVAGGLMLFIGPQVFTVILNNSVSNSSPLMNVVTNTLMPLIILATVASMTIIAITITIGFLRID